MNETERLKSLIIEGRDLIDRMERFEAKEKGIRLHLGEIQQWSEEAEKWASKSGAILPDPRDKLDLVVGWEFSAYVYVLRVVNRLISYARQTFLADNVESSLYTASASENVIESRSFSYDIALSFAGEDRNHAATLADCLRRHRVRVFYDEYERAYLWGKNLYDHLAWVYKDAAHYSVLFLSENYERKLWTNHERRNAQARAFREREEYILPLRLDDTEIPGIPETVAYIDLRRTSIDEVCELLIQKLRTPRDNSGQ